MTDRPAMLRLLLVLPSWVGDAVMATPALVRLRESLPGVLFGALARPGIDRLLEDLTTPDGTPVIDEFHAAHPTGVLGPKFVAARIRPRRYDTALLFTGSFSTALTVRVAGIPRRVGYDRDGRGFLLTRRLHPPRREGGGWALIPAVSYYWHAASALIDHDTPAELPAPTLTDPFRAATLLPPGVVMRLAVSTRDLEEARRVRASAGLEPGRPFAILNPGGNNPAKRWPAERFSALADDLSDRHDLAVLVNGSPAERDLCRTIAAGARTARAIPLPDHAHTLGSLKSLCRDARLMVTNDTGPRHIAAAFGTPTVALFGPTDPRWTTIPTTDPETGRNREIILVADPTLPPAESANDHPDRCAIERISLDAVREASDRMLVH
jgi:heptosyltransferase-2